MLHTKRGMKTEDISWDQIHTKKRQLSIMHGDMAVLMDATKPNDRKWFPPRDQRSNYKFFKRWPFKVEVLNDLVLKNRYSMFLLPATKQWLTEHVGLDKYGYQMCELTVVFGFKTDMDRIMFEAHLGKIT